MIQSFLYGREHEPVQTKDIPWARVALVGRVFIGAIFIAAGIAKLTDWSGTAEVMRTEGIVSVNAMLLIATLVELVGGLSVVTGTATRAGALALALFLIPTTLIFHDFWAYDGAARQAQLIQFLKNLSIMGGLLLIIGFGAGRVSVDERIKDRMS
jgi:putative oxidoreductase